MLLSIFSDVINHYSRNMQNRIEPSVGTKLQQFCPALWEVVTSSSFHSLHALWFNCSLLKPVCRKRSINPNGTSILDFSVEI